jgi:hypothetical protein
LGYNTVESIENQHVASIFRDEEQDVHPKRRLTFNGLRGVISQKIELSITTAARISNPITFKFLTAGNFTS